MDDYIKIEVNFDNFDFDFDNRPRLTPDDDLPAWNDLTLTEDQILARKKVVYALSNTNEDQRRVCGSLRRVVARESRVCAIGLMEEALGYNNGWNTEQAVLAVAENTGTPPEVLKEVMYRNDGYKVSSGNTFWTTKRDSWPEIGEFLERYWSAPC